jgi:DNA-binding SARP family transcriptional activator
MGVARLRKALGPLNGDGESPLRTVGGGYLLTVRPCELDAERFTARLEDGLDALNTGNAARAAELLREAMKVWRGTPLAEVYFEDFAQPELRRLEEMRLVALESRIEAELQLGRHEHLIGELAAILAHEPTRERVASQLMLALYRSGRQADALDVYQRTRIHLATQLGLEPGPALTALQVQMLRHCPSLDPSHRPGNHIQAARPPGDDHRAAVPDWTNSRPALVGRGFNSSTSPSRPLPTRLTPIPEQRSLRGRLLAVGERMSETTPAT